MNFVGILLAFSIVIALFGSYGAMKNTKNTKDFRAKGKDRFQSSRLRFVDRKQFADLYESEGHHVLFQLQDSQTGRENGDTLPQRVGITLRELEKCIPWVPGDSRIFICSPDGFSPSLLKQLKVLRTQRDLFLIDNLPNDLGAIRMVVS
jgi:hypothetical protein